MTGQVTFDAGGKRYTAIFGFKAMKLVESAFEAPFFAAVQKAMPALDEKDMDDPVKVAAAGASLQMANVSTLFGAALARHHPDLTEDEIDDVLDDIGLQKTGEVLGAAVAAAIAKQGGDGASPANPRTKGRAPARKG